MPTTDRMRPWDVAAPRRRAGRELLVEFIAEFAVAAGCGSVPATAIKRTVDPRLFCEAPKAQPFATMTIEQIVAHSMSASIEPVVARTDADGHAYVPRVGGFATGLPNAEVQLRLPGSGSRATAIDAHGRHFESRFVPSLLLPGTDIEVVSEVDPVLDAFLADHLPGWSTNVLVDPNAYVEAITRSLELIGRVDFSYWAALRESVRTIVLFEVAGAESFAALGAHGAIFVNIEEASTTVQFVEHIAHQGGHVLFAEATIDRGSIYAVDPDTPIGEFCASSERRSANDLLHGLFTEHVEYRLMLALLQEPDELTEGERHAAASHLCAVSARHDRDLRHLEPHVAQLFTETGAEFFEAFLSEFGADLAVHGRTMGMAKS